MNVFYKERAKVFNEIADKLESDFNEANFIGHHKFAFEMARVRSEAKEWYDEVRQSAFLNNVDIGSRKNFLEVLNAQIDKATEEEREYIKAILKFLEFYYSRF